METKVNYVLVGGFVLVLGAALVAGILWLASGGGFQKKYDLYLALVGESVAGLNLNAPVKYVASMWARWRISDSIRTNRNR
jgi:phospholipid/cholesterol/gamma-HCH transport system substrate-binding protein